VLRVVTASAQQAVSEGGAIQIAHAVRVWMAAGLTFLVMRGPELALMALRSIVTVGHCLRGAQISADVLC
jgi:hypothetical protein